MGQKGGCYAPFRGKLGPHLTRRNSSSRLATIDMGAQKVGVCPFLERAGSPSNTMWPGPRPIPIPSSTLIHTALWTWVQTTTQQQQQPFYGPLSRTTRVSWNQKKHSPTHHPDHHPIFISCVHIPRSIASSLFKLCAWQSFCTTSLHVLFGLPGLPLGPYISSPNQCLLFAAHAHTIAACFAAVSILYHLFLVFLSTPYLELLSFILTLHIHLTILISAC